ncbi:hypothetical protein R5R35_004592 [Gryllus longicercus]|uniref:MD-2-related lipid-recognition domain-containing protein n=1 Tax=Gryllus longicercus TaxID=2509291 RepID=A0AAN9W171_9ORTH
MAVSKSLALLGLFCFLGVAYGEVVTFQACPDETREDGSVVAPRCEVHELRITPCAEAAENKPCKVKRGRAASIEFDFTVAATLHNATSRAYWANDMTDLPLVGMDTNSCGYTACPIQANARQAFAQSLPLSKKFPVRTYDVKWRLTNEEEGVKCCFIFKIKLVK